MRQMACAVVLSLMLAACGGVGDESAETTTTTDTVAASTTTAESPTSTEPTEPTSGDSADASSTTTTTAVSEESGAEGSQPEPVPTTEGSSVSSRVPEQLMADIMADVEERSGATESEFTVVRAAPAIWNDGSLGCPVPGESYTQALVNGYWVVIEVGGLEYDYRATDRGYFKLCEGGGSPPSNPTG